jgi:hypothetical protein
MHEKADSMGVDLLLIDTGDRVEGNGIYDASSPKGKYTYDIFREQEIDVITTGNHELYQTDAADREYEQTVPNFKGHYLASNLDYINPKTREQVPMAQRYRIFTTKNLGIRVLAFGFLFDFTGNGNNSIVQPVEKTIKEAWFQEAIREKVDLFIVAGHVTLPGPEYKAIFQAIRGQNWDTPIQFFGGHSHIRDYHKYDSKSYGLQGGRYMETVGWMSIEGIKGKGKAAEANNLESRTSLSFQRRYIDNNLFGYHYHTGLNETTFPTKRGLNASAAIYKARKALKLDHKFGCAPKDLWVNRAPYPSNDSVYTWLETEVIPEIAVIPERKDVPTLAIINTGTIRFDIFKGAFTRDTTYIISPFISKLVSLKDVPYNAAKRVEALINSAGQILQAPGLHASQLTPPEQMGLHSNINSANSHGPHAAGDAQSPLMVHDDPPLTPGYTTKDDAGDEGDDTLHTPLTFYNVPNVIQSARSFPTDADPEKVDLVFTDFIVPWVLSAMQFTGQNYTAHDIAPYGNETLTDLIADWIMRHWGQEC